MTWCLRIFILASALFSNSASATILFLDLDYSPAEIRAAQTAAKARGESLVVLPLRTPNETKLLDQINELRRQRKAIKIKSHNIWIREAALKFEQERLQESPHPDQRRIDLLQSQRDQLNRDYAVQRATEEPKLKEIDGRISPLVKKIRTITIKELDATLGTLETYRQDPEPPITSLVISGHHDSLGYTGILGSLELQTLARTFKQYPHLTRGLKSAYGWGCYSASPQWASWWAETFPGIQLVGGFDSAGPDDDRPASSQFLTGLLTREAAVRKQASAHISEEDVRAFTRMIQHIPGYRMLNGAVLSCGLYTSVNRGTADLSQMEHTCSADDLATLQAIAPRAESMIRGAPRPVEDPPCDTQHSWLRDYYSSLRQHEHCGSFPVSLRADYAKLVATADQVVRLIFFQQVYENYVSYFREDLNQLRQLTESCKAHLPDLSLPLACAPPPDQNDDPHRMHRRDLLQMLAAMKQCTLPSTPVLVPKKEWKEQMQEFFGKKPKPMPVPPPTYEQKRLNDLRVRNNIFLRDLNCIPLNWVEPPLPGRPLDRPPCQERKTP